MKRIRVLIGSGIKGGNTDKLARAFAEGAAAAGHQVTEYFMGDKRIEGCRGCNACRYQKPCVLQDDMQEIYPLLADCDTVVLASPLYFWTISARIKAFIERLYAVAAEDPNPPLGRYERQPERDCALLMTAADDLFWTFNQATSYYQFTVVNYLGWHDRGMLLAGGCGGSGDERHIEDTGHLGAAYAFGQRI